MSSQFDFFTACFNNDLNEVNRLLNRQVLANKWLPGFLKPWVIEDINPAYNDNSALKCAAEHGHLAIVNRLLEIPAVLENAHPIYNHNEETRIRFGEPPATPLSLAARNGHLESVQRLLQIPLVSTNAHIYNNDALKWAARNGHLAVVNCLLEIPAVLENVTVDFNKPLELAIHYGKFDVVQRLLQIPAIRQNPSFAGPFSTIRIALEQGHHNIVDLLRAHGALNPAELENRNPQINQLNDEQSVHEVSIHVSVSRSARNLYHFYNPNAHFIEANLADMKHSLDNDFNHAETLDGYKAEWLEPAKTCFDRLSKLDFEDPRSGVTMQQALALVWAGINNANEFEKKAKPEHVERLDRRITLIKNLYEIQRGYNLQGDGANPIDNKKSDDVTCVTGSFNKLIAALASVGHTGVEIIFVTKELITAKAELLTKQAFSLLSEEQKAHFALNWEGEKSDEIQAEYFNLIKISTAEKLHAEYNEFSEEIHGGSDKAINEAMGSIQFVGMSDIMKAYQPVVLLPAPAPEPVLFIDPQQRRQLFAAAAEKRLLSEQEDSAAKRQKIAPEQATVAAETQKIEMSDVEAEENTLVQASKRMKR